MARPRNITPNWSDDERGELMKGWRAGESYSGIAIRLSKAFSRRYTRNMVARQCRDMGLRRSKRHAPEKVPFAELVEATRGLPWRSGSRRSSEEVDAERRRRARIRAERAERNEEICTLRENGKSMHEIARMYGISVNSVRWTCLVGGAHTGVGSRGSVVPSELEAKIVALREMGLTVSQISRETGVTITTIRYRLAVDAARAEADGWG